MRKFIPKTLIGKISLLLILVGISLPLFNDSIFPDQVKRCGKVIDKMVIPKHKSSADLVFLVQFENEFVDIEVNRATYMRFHTGDNVCFMLPPKESSSVTGLMILYMMLSWIGCGIYIIHFFVNDDY